MNMVSLEALCVFVDAMDTTGTAVTLRDIVRVLEHLDTAGWEIARKPTARAVTVNDPAPAVTPAEQTQWPPAGISRLWATDMEPDRTAFVEVESIWELRAMAERGATFIDDINHFDAISTSNNRSHAVKKTFHVNDSTFEYLTDEIPF